MKSLWIFAAFAILVGFVAPLALAATSSTPCALDAAAGCEAAFRERAVREAVAQFGHAGLACGVVAAAAALLGRQLRAVSPRLPGVLVGALAVAFLLYGTSGYLFHGGYDVVATPDGGQAVVQDNPFTGVAGGSVVTAVFLVALTGLTVLACAVRAAWDAGRAHAAGR